MFGPSPMATTNPHTHELSFKLVFYGPGLGGKTTSLRYTHAAMRAEHRGDVVSIASPGARTLHFDFLPVRLPKVRGMTVRLQLFTVPGHVHDASTRRLLLTGADGVIFVADSQVGRLEQNEEALEDLRACLTGLGRPLSGLPHTFHWNKRDLSELAPIPELERRLNLLGAPSIATIATRGDGVFEGLQRVTRLVLQAHGEGADAAPEDDGIDRVLRLASASSPASPRDKVAGEAAAFRREEQVTALSNQLLAPREAQPPKARGALTFRHLFCHGERPAVEEAEEHLSTGDARAAVLACDMALARLLTAIGASLGPGETPRDPALSAMLLGLDGPRYLAFRAAVRGARCGEAVLLATAYDCFLLLLEARRLGEAVKPSR